MPDVFPVDTSGANFAPPVTAWRYSPRKEKPEGGIAKAPYAAMKKEWKIPSSRTDGFMSIHDDFNDADGVVYFGTVATAPCDGTWRLHVGHDGGVRVFVDGKDVLTAAKAYNPATPGRSHVDVTLSKGKHDIVVAFDLAAGRGWGMYTHIEAIGKMRRSKTKKVVFPTFTV